MLPINLSDDRYTGKACIHSVAKGYYVARY